MKRALLAAMLAVLCISALVQYQAARKSRADAARLRDEVARLEALRADAESARVAQYATDTNELERLRAEHSELVRLRGQVAQLRRDLQAAQQALAKARVPATAPANTNSPSTEPVQKFVANIQATVPPQQTLITGGWKLPTGKHTLFFIEPVLAGQNTDSAGQISVETRIVELSEEAMARFGFSGLKSDATEISGHMLLPDAQLRLVVRAMEQEQGLDILGAPKVSTLSGRPAQVKITNTQTTSAGESFEMGPMLDLVPTVAADGKSIDMRVSAQMRLPASR